MRDEVQLFQYSGLFLSSGILGMDQANAKLHNPFPLWLGVQTSQSTTVRKVYYCGTVLYECSYTVHELGHLLFAYIRYFLHEVVSSVYSYTMVCACVRVQYVSSSMSSGQQTSMYCTVQYSTVQVLGLALALGIAWLCVLPRYCACYVCWTVAVLVVHRKSTLLLK